MVGSIFGNIITTKQTLQRIHVTDQSDECKNQKKINLFGNAYYDLHEACKINYFEFIFYANFDFYLISIPNCLLPSSQSNQEKKRMLVESLYRQKKLKHNVEKSWDATKKLNAILKGEAEINQLQHEVNSLYCNNAGKNYAIVTKKPFIDFIANSDLVTENYKSAIKYLNEFDKKEFINEVEELYYLNTFYGIQQATLIKTIDHLTKQLKNGNNKIS